MAYTPIIIQASTPPVIQIQASAQASIVVSQTGAKGADATQEFCTSMDGIPTAGQTLLWWVFSEPVTLTVGKCKARVKVAPTASYTATIYKNGTIVGTILWAAGQVVGAITMADQSMVANDELKVIAPGSLDATLSGVLLIFGGA